MRHASATEAIACSLYDRERQVMDSKAPLLGSELFPAAAAVDATARPVAVDPVP
jgi:hypothetical protein